MSKYRQYKPYIRRLSSKDKSESFVTATRMAYYQIANKTGFALVQHGCKNVVIEVADTKADLKRKLLFRESFKGWQNRVKYFGQLAT